jgi:AcrR family transcriptional regulator
MPSTTSSARRASPLPPAERRDAILTAVLPLLLERGAAVTSRELAAAAGVAEGTIFKVFTDKDDLLLAAFERAADPTPFQQAVAAIDPDLPFEERLVEATALMQRRLLDITRLHSQIDPAGRRPAPDRLPDDPAMTAVFESAPECVRPTPNEAARQLRAVVLNLSNPVFVDPPLDARQIVELFLHGVGSDR